MPDFQKQNVQWFPGHMAKTRRLIKESLKLVDGVVEIVDARIPRSSSNPELSQIINKKPKIVLLNKCDMADPAATELWIKYYAKNGITAIAVDCKTGKGLNKFQNACEKALSSVIKRNKEKGMEGKALRLMVVGIPNTGKSSFINRMAGKYKAVVADKAGVTRSNQWFSAGNGIELLDTPGVLWPKFEDDTVGEHLAFTGAVKDRILDTELLAVRLIELLSKKCPEKLLSRYGELELESDSYDILCQIGKKRGMVIRGGETDTERAANMLLEEYRSCKIGNITLERVEDYA